MKPLFIFIVFAISSIQSTAQSLVPGNKAPAIQIGTWVKGNPVQEFHADSNYVVEFWATWCGPCKESIPHLTEMAKQYPQLKIIGVSIAEANTNNVRPFVESMGDQMNYTVAIDKQESETARKGYMSTHWLEAAGLTGIPTAFVIQKNQVAWIGHPMKLDSVLAAVNKNTWDTKKFARKYKKEKEEEKLFVSRLEQYNNKLAAHARDGEKKQFYKTLDEQLQFMTEKGSWPAVNEQIWSWLADPASNLLAPQMKDYAFGIKWMEKLTARAEGQNAAYFDTLAWCYHGAGQKAKAIETETKALDLLPANDPGRANYEQALNTFGN